MKTTSIELKKYFKHPATYIVAALLILVMLISIMVYKPTLETDTSIKSRYETILKGKTAYEDVYNYFTGEDGSDLSLKALKNNLQGCLLEEYNPSNEDNNTKLKLNNYITSIETILNKNTHTQSDISFIKSDLNLFENILETATSKYGNFNAVITDTARTNIKNCIKSAIDITDNVAYSIQDKIAEFKSTAVVNSLKTNLNGLENYLPSAQDYEKAKEYQAKGLKLFNETVEKFNKLPNTNGNLDELYSYIEACSKVYDYTFFIVTNLVKTSAINVIGESKAKQFGPLNNLNLYEYKEQIVKYEYLLNYFEENGTYLNYVEPINISYTFIDNVNIADYVGFVCTLCTFVIVLYVSIMGAINVNSEFKLGTMRMIATKPIKKSSIISGKIWATIFYGLILLLLTFIISVIMGGIAYGFSTAPVLLIINASIVFECNVFIELILFLLTLIIQVVLFASIGILISTLINNKIIAATVSSIIYFVSIVFNIVKINISFLPFTNINLWKYFGGSFLITNNKNFFSLLFSSTPTATNTIILNIISFVIFIILAQIITHIVFKKKEIR